MSDETGTPVAASETRCFQRANMAAACFPGQIHPGRPDDNDGVASLGLVLLTLVACGSAQETGPGTGPDVPAAGSLDGAGTPQRPPRGQRALEPWLAAGHHLQWKCEQDIFPSRMGGLHGRHRICSNDLLLGSTSESYPAGAASVKELFDDRDRPNGFSVGLKIEEGVGGHTWYWYERTGRLTTFTPRGDGVGDPACSVCHQTAVRDYVFIRAE